MLPDTYRSSTRLGGRAVLVLMMAGGMVWALPTLRGAAAHTQEEEPVAERAQHGPAEAIHEPAGDVALRERWGKLDDEQAARLAKQHVQAIMFAAHVYAEKQGDPLALPPAAVPNPDLPAEKRLSGLVLLLPHLGVKPNYIATGERWALEPFDEEVYRAARELYKKIDLTKAWDDAANLEAARTVVPMFLVPGGGTFRDEGGYAVSHFAFVRGGQGEDNGAFPKDRAIKFGEIVDGTSCTLAVGQVRDHLSPWVAAGPFASRFVYHPASKTDYPGFGSQFGDAAYFAFVDASGHFLDMAGLESEVLYNLANLEDRRLVPYHVPQIYRSAVEWRASQETEPEK